MLDGIRMMEAIARGELSTAKIAEWIHQLIVQAS
jgi:hypothetical protein